jgi:hypothetical protein
MGVILKQEIKLDCWLFQYILWRVLKEMVCLLVQSVRVIFTSESVSFWLFFCSLTLLIVRVWTGCTGCGQQAGFMDMSVKLRVTHKEGDWLISWAIVRFWRRTLQSPWSNSEVLDCVLGRDIKFPDWGFSLFSPVFLCKCPSSTSC